MRIHKQINKNITIKLTTEKTYHDIVCSEQLFCKDLSYWFANEDHWQYLIDDNTGEVYPLNGYGYDSISDLLIHRKIELKPGNKADYIDYEWNQERRTDI